MRNIATLSSEKNAQRFSNFLRKEGIENVCEQGIDPKTDKALFTLWIHNEDEIEKAKKYWEEFQKNPEDLTFEAPVEKEEKKGEFSQKPSSPPRSFGLSAYKMTLFLIAFCVSIYFLNGLQTAHLKEKRKGSILITPIQIALLYDIPSNVILLDSLIERYGIDIRASKDKIPENVEKEIANIEKTPSWKGIYTWLVLSFRGKDVKAAEGPMFVKIGQGEVWRLFTPCVLHKDFLHILFNMIWLWILGKQVEKRLSRWRYLVLILLLGIISNTFQYLMSGPYFLGFSGVVVGMATFIWMRQKMAPWEGYPLQKSIFVFLVFFVFSMLFLQSASFFFQAFSDIAFSPNIANTAHITGGVVGLVLGRLPFFGWRPLER